MVGKTRGRSASGAGTFIIMNMCWFYVSWLMTFVTAVQYTHVDRSTYEEGRKQFELIKNQSGMPHYGQCWKDALVLTQTGCKRLTDDVQGRLALAYLNCFLDLQGRRKYECNQDNALEKCTKSMEDADRVSFTTFFTHTQSICYFLQAQVWNERTENTISELAETSSNVAAQLQKSSQLQSEIIKQQNDSLRNQKIIMENAANLTSTLSRSSSKISRLFQTFKETTEEQRILITDVFDQLTSLKQTVLGEFSGFYSILYYFFSVLVSYLLTSTARTSGARFWLFSIVTVSIFCEYFITSWSTKFLAMTSVHLENYDDWMYWLRKSCRRLFAILGLIVLAVFAYTYCDINSINNKLLVEIRREISDLIRLQGGSSTEASSDSDDSVDSSSDRTYILQEAEGSTDDTGSYMTAETIHGSEATSYIIESLKAELRDLHRATPLKEMAGQMERWITTGLYSSPSSNRAPSATGNVIAMNDTPRGSPYMLRPRQGRTSISPSPATQVESPRSFARTLKQLERIAQKNSRVVCAEVAKKPANCLRD